MEQPKEKDISGFLHVNNKVSFPVKAYVGWERCVTVRACRFEITLSVRVKFNKLLNIIVTLFVTVSDE